MLASSVLLAVPLLLSASAHPSPLFAPGHHNARSEINVAVNSVKEGHLGFPLPQGQTLEAIAGMSARDVSPLSSLKKMRRRKRACKAPSGTGSSNSTTNVADDQSSSTLPASMSESATASPSATWSATWSDSASATASAVSASEPSASSTSDASSGTPSNGTSSGGSGGAMSSIFPAGSGSASWTTSTESSSALSFDAALKPLQFGSLPSQGNAPDGSTSLIADYPAGIVDLSGSGYSFYTEGAVNGVNIEGAKEVTFTFSVFFEEGFDFVKGGKLPGLYGGTSLSAAKSCSGGRQTDRNSCFSARVMWRTGGNGEMYNYLPPTAAANFPEYCSLTPTSTCNAQYGDSVGRGLFQFQTGQWNTVAQRFKMNDMGQSNGEQELYINGQSAISINNMQYAQEDGFTFYGIMAQTFFGGNDASWAPSSDMKAYFKDWSLAILA